MDYVTYIVDRLTLDFANIVWAGLRFLNHLHGDWGENAVFTTLTSELFLRFIQVSSVTTETSHVLRHKESIVVISRKLAPSIS